LNATSKAKSGIVVPRRLKWHHHAAAWLIATGGRTLAGTWRCPVIDHYGVFASPPPQVIFAVWHNRLAISMRTWQWVRKRVPAAGLVALISASHDGGVLSRALKYFDVEAVRGSSSRRGAQALLELTSWIERGYHVAITPDGPRGPRYAVRDGVIALAQVTGLPIVPVSSHVKGKICTKSWDRFQIPVPFARCEIRLGQLLTVPRDLTDSERKNVKSELQRRLTELTED
jgi:lysophospholipid acyltransferase (LPLAT)-like uncharacterized protein